MGDPSSWGDTRPITLSSAILKWFSQLLLKRCGGKIQDGAPYQWASRGKQAPELLVILRRVVRMAKDWGTPTWIIKLDVRKAFDSVWQETMGDMVARRVGGLRPGGGGTRGGEPWQARAWLSLLEARELNVAIGDEVVSVVRWSTFQLQHTWELYGHMARSKHGGRDMLQWRNLKWWEAEKNKPKSQRATHAHRYNPFADTERQIVRVAKLDWMDTACNMPVWAALAAEFVKQFDVAWASGKQASLQNLTTVLKPLTFAPVPEQRCHTMRWQLWLVLLTVPWRNHASVQKPRATTPPQQRPDTEQQRPGTQAGGGQQQPQQTAGPLPPAGAQPNPQEEPTPAASTCQAQQQDQPAASSQQDTAAQQQHQDMPELDDGTEATGGWTKGDHQHWRDLGPAVGLFEEDSESEWEKVLARGRRQRRWTQPTTPTPTPDWGDLLNRHLLPRQGDPQSTQLAQQQEGQTQPAQQAQGAAAASHPKPSKQQTATDGDSGGPSGRRRMPTPTSTTAAAEQQENTMEGIFNVLYMSHGRGPRPLTAPPELPIAQGVTLHMRSGPYGIWAAVTTHTGANFAADYGPSPARNYARARQVLQSHQQTPNAYIGVNTAFTLLPWGDITQGSPEKFLMWITATGGHRDPEGAEMHPGDAFILEWDRAERRWRPGNLPRKVAQQYYYDWGRHRGTPMITRPPPPGATHPLGHWEQMAMNLIPRPYTMGGQASSSSSGQQQPPQPGPSPPPPPRQPHRTGTSRDTDQPSLMQQQQVAQTQLDDSVACPSHGPTLEASTGEARGAQPREVAAMLCWLRELAAWAAEQQMPVQVRYEMESAMAVLGDCLHHARLQHNAQGDNVKKRGRTNQVLAARLRLLDLCDDTDDDLNQHQIYEDLRVIERLLKEGTQQFQEATQGKEGELLRQGSEGLSQTLAAVQRAQAATVQGDLDWCTSSWGTAVAILLEEAQEAVEEHNELGLVHSSDVLGLSQGANEGPRRPPEPGPRLEAILGDIREALGFLTAGPHSQVLNVLAAVAMWQSQNMAYNVETQTTEGGDEIPHQAMDGGGRQQSRWVPQPGAPQWSGSLPSSADEARTDRSTDEGGPTDEDLIQAMEEYERQQERRDLEEAEEEARCLFTRRRTEGGSAESHRRRRMHAGDP
ncbi:hus1 [Symbiodinium necroappetens]|uniref:Hus1 protein n=1 Tax=Symbiodinium necroappetens TaxID=1628268 RepID=A0A812PCW3_9DINO|nr:hus1 [Symbiodinium necroappetens]